MVAWLLIFWKALLPMVLDVRRVVLITIDFNFGVLAKALLPIDVTLAEIRAFVSFSHP